VTTLRIKRPVRRSDVWVRQVSGENAIYDPLTQAVHLLNDTALAIWEQCDGATTPSEMVGAIVDLSGLHEEVVVEDVGRTLAEFDRAGLVRWVDA
jgi:hypothetical protein